MRRVYLLLLAVLTLFLSACASMPGREPLQVTVADIESLPGEGMELRMLVKLRVQNPSESALEYDGVYVKLEVQGKTYATGISDEQGVIPRFGEAVVEVPVTISAVRAALNAYGLMRGGAPEKLNYHASGHFGGSVFGSMSFSAEGDVALPGGP
jgi:hypothetical protein